MADRGTTSGGDSLGKGIGLLMAPILGILPYVLPADAVPDELRNVFWLVPLLVVGVVYLIRPGGVFARDRLGPTLLGRIIAGLLGVVYVVGTALLLSTETSVFWATLVVGSLYASALLMVRAAHQVEWSDAAASLAIVLLGVAVLLGGVAFLRDGALLLGVALLLGGVAFLLAGVAVLRDGYGAPGWRRWVEQAVSRLTRRDEAEAHVSSGQGPHEGGESE